MGKISYFSWDFIDYSLDRPLRFNGRRKNVSEQRRELVGDGMNFAFFLPVTDGNPPRPGPPTIIPGGGGKNVESDCFKHSGTNCCCEIYCMT